MSFGYRTSCSFALSCTPHSRTLPLPHYTTTRAFTAQRISLLTDSPTIKDNNSMASPTSFVTFKDPEPRDMSSEGGAADRDITLTLTLKHADSLPQWVNLPCLADNTADQPVTSADPAQTVQGGQASQSPHDRNKTVEHENKDLCRRAGHAGCTQSDRDFLASAVSQELPGPVSSLPYCMVASRTEGRKMRRLHAH